MKKKVDITGVLIDNFSYQDVISRIETFISEDKNGYIVTVNPEMIINASKDEKFFNILEKAEIRTPDGIGILWAANYLHSPKLKNKVFSFFQLLKSLFAILYFPKKTRKILKERVTGSDLFPKIVDYSQDKSWNIFLLGASDGVADKAIKKLSKIYPEAKFVGCYAGTPEKSDEDEICDFINQAKPHILFVAYGSPSQEFWIYRNLFKLKSVNVAIGVGGSFDFFAKKIKRAPKWMQKVGLEWLWRLFREPGRVVRIWNATVMFVKLVYREKNKKLKN